MESAGCLQFGNWWWRGRLLRLRAVEEVTMLERLPPLSILCVLPERSLFFFARVVAYRRAESRQQLHLHSRVLGSIELESQCKP